eukprot:21589_1
MLLLANYCVSHAQSSASPCLCSFTEWFRTHLSFGTLLAGGLLQNIIEFAAHPVTSQFAIRMLVTDQAAGDFSDEQSYVGGIHMIEVTVTNYFAARFQSALHNRNIEIFVSIFPKMLSGQPTKFSNGVKNTW